MHTSAGEPTGHDSIYLSYESISTVCKLLLIGSGRMMWRAARLDPDGTLASAIEGSFENVLCRRPAAETSLAGRLKQRLSSDEQLADQLQSGSADALTVLFKRHSPLVFGISRRVLRNDAEAEDAVQQIFLDVFRSIHQFDPEKGSFKTWLLMFTYHRTFNRRRSQITNKFFETDPLEERISVSQRAGSGQSATENRLLVGQVLRSLQPRQRRTIELVYYEGLTAEEVSVRTGESVRVVRHNLYRGLDKLRRTFGAERSSFRHKEVQR